MKNTDRYTHTTFLNFRRFMGHLNPSGAHTLQVKNLWLYPVTSGSFAHTVPSACNVLPHFTFMSLTLNHLLRLSF